MTFAKRSSGDSTNVTPLRPPARTPTSGDKVRAKRLEAGLTQEELGRRFGVDARQVRRIESGESPTTALDMYLKLDELAAQRAGKKVA